jgi:hypothetical protein
MAYQNFTPEELATEEWRDVVGFEGYYKVSNIGRIKSIHTKWATWSERLLRPNISGRRSSYPKVTLVRDGQHFYRRVHRLVIEAFIGSPPQDKQCVNHIDANRSNNRMVNLEYCSHQDNTDHANALGRLRRGEDHPRALLTEAQVLIIRASNTHPKVLAAEFGVAESTIWMVRNRQVWKHI